MWGFFLKSGKQNKGEGCRKFDKNKIIKNEMISTYLYFKMNFAMSATVILLISITFM